MKLWLFESLSKMVICRVANVQGQRHIVFVVSCSRPVSYFVVFGVVLAVKRPLFSQCTYRNPKLLSRACQNFEL